MQLAMTPNEEALLQAFLRRAQVYVEFGSGGSTVLAANLVSKAVLSVDSSTEWLDNVRDACAVQGSPIRPHLEAVDIGPTGTWGFPIDQTTKTRWPDYYTKVWGHSLARHADVYLIDGRFRVACFMQAVLRGPAHAFYIVHDFDSRPQYHVIREVAQEVAIAGELSVFVPGRGFDREKATKALAEYALTPD